MMRLQGLTRGEPQTNAPFGVTKGVACFNRVNNEIIQTEKIDANFAYGDNLTVCGDFKRHDGSLGESLRH